jgi:hypothetical protein
MKATSLNSVDQIKPQNLWKEQFYGRSLREDDQESLVEELEE